MATYAHDGILRIIIVGHILVAENSPFHGKVTIIQQIAPEKKLFIPFLFISYTTMLEDYHVFWDCFLSFYIG